MPTVFTAVAVVVLLLGPATSEQSRKQFMIPVFAVLLGGVFCVSLVRFLWDLRTARQTSDEVAVDIDANGNQVPDQEVALKCTGHRMELRELAAYVEAGNTRRDMWGTPSAIVLMFLPIWLLVIATRNFFDMEPSFTWMWATVTTTGVAMVMPALWRRHLKICDGRLVVESRGILGVLSPGMLEIPLQGAQIECDLKAEEIRICPTEGDRYLIDLAWYPRPLGFIASLLREAGAPQENPAPASARADHEQ